MDIHVYSRMCITITEARHGIAQQPCIWQYLTCFRKRSLVTEMRSRSDNSHVEYYTLQELASALISRLACSCSRRHVYLFPRPFSPSLTPSLSLCPPSLFVTFVLYTLCPRFDSFDSFAMERENAAARSTVREKPLETTLKFDRPAASGTTENFYPAPPWCTRVHRFTFPRTHARSQYVFITGGSQAKLLRIRVTRHWWNSSVHFCGLESLAARICENNVVYSLGERIISE